MKLMKNFLSISVVLGLDVFYLSGHSYLTRNDDVNKLNRVSLLDDETIALSRNGFSLFDQCLQFLICQRVETWYTFKEINVFLKFVFFVFLCEFFEIVEINVN